ncbi:MAG: hypothetical protein ACKO3W_09275 [bacterium]
MGDSDIACDVCTVCGDTVRTFTHAARLLGFGRETRDGKAAAIPSREECPARISGNAAFACELVIHFTFDIRDRSGLLSS